MIHLAFSNGATVRRMLLLHLLLAQKFQKLPEIRRLPIQLFLRDWLIGVVLVIEHGQVFLRLSE